jgi:hypothetical protein
LFPSLTVYGALLVLLSSGAVIGGVAAEAFDPSATAVDVASSRHVTIAVARDIETAASAERRSEVRFRMICSGETRKDAVTQRPPVIDTASRTI